MYDTIVVATDGSGSANRAVTHALEQAERFGATLHGIYVVDTKVHAEPAFSNIELATHEIEEYGDHLLDEINERADDLGIEFVSMCCHGRPHQEIISYADGIDADMIVIGFQGLSHTEHETIGSVTERVVRSAGRPILIG